MASTERKSQSSSVKILVIFLGALAALGLIAVPVVGNLLLTFEKQQCRDDLRKLGIAIHNYHADHKCLPKSAITDKSGQPLLSWRVALLPYLGEDSLYGEFHLDEAWDSPNNRALIPRMPKVFRDPRVRTEPGTTPYQVFVGPGTLFDPIETITFETVAAKDGLSNTILIAEGAEPVIWTQPKDLDYQPQQPPPALFHKHTISIAAFGDASIGYIQDFRI